MYHCGYCKRVTTSRTRIAGTRGDRKRFQRIPISAYECARCGNMTCFDGERQIPQYVRYPNCKPVHAAA